MKAILRIGIAAFCLLFSSGCTLCHNLSQTSVVQPIQYWNYWDKLLERHQFRKMARVELERARSAARAESDNYSFPPFSIDHERGFEDGFVDFLIYGGPGNPPPLPPRRYWWSDCQSLDGCDAIQDWFRGFQHGVAVAQASGYRDCVTVQVSDALVKDTLPVYLGQRYGSEPAEAAGETDGGKPASIPAIPPDSPATPPPLAEPGLAPGKHLPAGGKPPVGPFPVLHSSESSGAETPLTSVRDLRAAFMVQEAEALNAASQARARTASSLPSGSGVALHPALIERE